MKSSSALRSFLALAGSSLLAISSAHAAVYYWDTDGDTAGFGNTAGTWGSNAFWTTVSGGGATHTAFTSPTTSDEVNFGTASLALGATASAVAVTGTVNAQSITFGAGQTTAIVLSGGTIDLAGTSSITVNNTSDTINSVLSGAATSLTKAGSISGTLILGGNNTYTGATIVNAGNLSITHNNALGTTAGATTINGSNGTTGASLILSNATTDLTVAEAFNLAANSAGRANVSNNSAQNHILSGAIDITSSGTNGRVSFLSEGNGSITISGDVSGTMGGDAAAILFLRGTSTNLNNQVTGDITFTGGKLQKTDAGTWTLSGTNTYTGLTEVSAGTLIVGANAPSGNAGAFGNATSEIIFGQLGNAGNDNASILTNGAFTIGRIIRNATANTTDAGTRVLTLGGNSADNSVFSGNIFLGTTNQTSKGIQLTAAAGGQVTFSGAIQNPTGQDATETTSAAALTAVTKVGAGTVILSGTNTYTGKTAVNVGTLLATKAAALPGYNAASKVSVASGATLAVNVDAGGWTSGEIDTLLGATPAAFTSGSKLGIDVTTGSFTYSTNIGTTQVAKGLVKSGAGTLVLDTATHTYTGNTEVNAGALIINGNISTSTLTTVASGATLGGSGTVGTTTISGIHSPGNSPGIITHSSLTYESGANVIWELVANSTASRGTNFDGINVGSTLDFNGATTLSLNFDFGTSAVEWDDNFWASNYTGTSGWLVYSGATSLDGFGNLGLNAPANWLDETGDTLASARTSASFSLFQDSNNIYLNYTAIPEPRAALLGGLGMLMLLRRRNA